MVKIDKIDLENIALIKKELKLKNVTTIKIKKGNYELEISSSQSNPPINISPISQTQEIKSIKKEIDKASEKNDNIIKSPMVGLAYLSAEPSSPPYAIVGQHIKQGDTVLLIEAMKTFNEVKAPKSGIIKKIIVINGQPVEFGDELIIFE